MKQLYEVRVREKQGPNKWVKKSKFYFVSGAAEAVGKYIGGGHIMWACKVPKEKILGVGSFFSLGKELMREFQGGDNPVESLELQKRNKEKSHNIKRRFYAEQERKEALQ